MAGDVDNVLNHLIGRVGRVRCWLLALSALRIAALGLAFICLYVGLYAWIDHHVRFGRVGRVSAFVLFAGMIAAGVYTIVRVLRREMTYAHAANYIENRRSFDQQLVAAVEYYEGRADYPYSRALARQLVLQVDREAQGYRFDSTVDKWRGYLLSGFILLCLLIVGFFVRQNVLYVSSYLSRLLRPLSEVQPMSATAVESVTGDIVTGPDAPVTLAAAVRGRAPDTAALVLTRRDPNDPNARSGAVSDRIEIIPGRDAEGNTTLAATRSFDATGRFEYRFEAGDVRSGSHTVSVCERPAIRSMTATVTPPATEGEPPIPSYEQDLGGGTLEVLPGSEVRVRVQATMPLQEATVATSEGQSTARPVDGSDSFSFEFTATRSSSIKLSMVSTDGLAGRTPQELRVALKSDERPQFKLLAPEGDYLATDVASIPITFEVTDDFGLTSARLFCEFPNGEPVVLESAEPHGAKQVHLAHTLELEQYDLHVGDSILFYATAADVETGHRRADANGCSEVYFIEIRPYRQYWHPEAGGPPSSQPGPIAEDLITILEYTRGILKKTWALARSSEVSEEDRSKSEALGGDVRYCAQRLAQIRDDAQAGFSDADKGVLNGVLDSYGQAEDRLGRGDASAALTPEQDAYRTLRKFIDELHMKWSPPESGQSVPQQTPERVRLQEQPEDRQLEKERIDSQLKEMQQRVDTLTDQQQSLKADLAKAMQHQKQPQSTRQSAGRQSSDGGSQAQQGQDEGTQQSAAQGGQTGQKEGTQTASQGDSGQSRRASQPGGQSGEGQGGEGTAGADGQAREGQNGSSSQTPPSAAGGQMSRSGAPSTAGGKAGPSPTDADAHLRMLQAKQKALREQVAQLNAELGRLPVPEYSAQGAAQSQAREHLKQAVEEMKRFEEKLADARYNSPASSESGDMAGPADSAARRLADAGEALGRTGSPDEQRTAADKAQDMAEELARDAQAYDESLSDAEKEQMQARLAAAERMLESMRGPQWTTVSRGGGPSSSLVYTKDGHRTPAETARLLARQFWSVALESRRRESRPVEREPSDVEFFEAENRFFENAATFRRPRGER